MRRISLLSSLVGLGALVLALGADNAAQGATLATPLDNDVSIFALPSIKMTSDASVTPQAITSGLPSTAITTSVGDSLGTFTYTIPPGDTIASATLSGTFTDSRLLLSPVLSFTLDTLLVGTSTEGNFSFTVPVNIFSSLSDGLSTLRFTTGLLLSTTYSFSNLALTINTTAAPVPEPSVIPGLLLVACLGGIVVFKAKQTAI
ncbi:MAG: PEP-CTERM sorting domain-containing protein [Anaerolineae bacterium]|nr:PEP-CTERM sorting domain-containing protein [Gloeobacterales cyanobacterium ES-bin-313]